MLTQKQIALKLGVSRQLVTLALGGYSQVSKESRQRILAAAQKMGYHPNPQARALQKKHTGIIGLWIPNQISTYYSRVARELSRLLKQEHRELIVSEVRKLSESMVLMNAPVDGIILVDILGQVKKHHQMLAHRSIPWVSIGAYPSKTIDLVQVDLRTGAMAVMKHLFDSGFRRIAHATFINKKMFQDGRAQAYRDAMHKAGLKPEFIYYPLDEELRRVTRQIIRNYIQQHGCPDAIFCHSDDAALGIYRGLCDIKLRVPQDVALVGCDGIEDTQYLECPLTTLIQPVPKMCAAAWGLLKRRLDNPKVKWKQLVLNPQLEIRESSTQS